MFWEKWIPKKYLVKSEICGVEANFSESGITFYYTHLKKKGDKLEIVDKGFSNDKPLLPKSIIKNKVPIVLVINGKGVILKKIFFQESEKKAFEIIIKENLPATNLNDFYVQLFHQESTVGYIAMCRKEQANNLINQFKDIKLEIAEVYIGTASIFGLQPLWNSFNGIRTSTHLAELNNGHLENLVNDSLSLNELIKIDDLAFESQYSLGLSAGLTYLIQRPIATYDNTELLLLKDGHTNKNKTRFLMVLLVGVAFLMAATNMIFYTNFFNSNNKLETELSVYQGKYEQINTLLADYQKKKELIENAGVLNRSKLGEYADRIAKTVPDEVVLSEMYFNPRDEDEDSEDSLVKFKNKELIIRGNCNKSLIVNEWLNVLKMQRFVKDIGLEKFSYNSEGLLPNYEIKLILE